MFQLIDVSTGVPVNGDLYITADAALAARAYYPGVKTRIQQVTDDSWMEREASRLVSGHHEVLPSYIVGYTKDGHFAHVAKLDRTKIAFTESPEKGMRDIQTVVPASTYLARFAGDQLSPDKIRDLAARYESRLVVNSSTLVISHARDAFRFAYNDQPVKSESSDHVSCMARSARSYTGTLNLHPAEAYATDQDGLAIAYTTDPQNPNSVTARAVVWPRFNHFVRVYGLTDQYRIALTAMLKERGYERTNSFAGAPLNRIPAETELDADDEDGTFLMPYLDGEDKCVDDHPAKRRFFICDSGDYAADETGGTIEVGNYSRTQCGCCGDRMHRDDDQYSVDGEVWCLSCFDNEAFTCEYHGESYSHSNGDPTTVWRRARRRDHNGIGSPWRTWEETWSGDAAQSYAFHCENTDQWYANGDYTAMEVIVNTRVGTQTWCQEETEGEYFRCPDCEEIFANDMAHPESVNTGVMRCHECHDAYVAEQEERGYPMPTFVADANQLELNINI